MHTDAISISFASIPSAEILKKLRLESNSTSLVD